MPSTPNEPGMQLFPYRTTSTYRSNSESRSALPSSCRTSLSEQNRTIADIIRKPSHEFSSHTLNRFLLPQEDTENTTRNTRERERTHYYETGNINSTKLHCAEKCFDPNTSEKHSTDIERLLQRSAREDVAVSSTCKILGHKNRDNLSSMTMNLPPPFLRKQTTGAFRTLSYLKRYM